MELSARNQFKGTIVSIKLGEVMAEVVTDIGGGNEIVSAVTRGSVEGLKLQEGQTVYAIIKSTEVIIGKDWSAGAPVPPERRRTVLGQRER